jgi:cobalt-zinc-cadmium efflux system outer membrane protein
MTGVRQTGLRAVFCLVVSACGAAAAAGLAGDADPPASLTREDALELALSYSPALEDFSWRSRSAEARTLQARKTPNTELDLRFWSLGERDGVEDVARRRVILNQEFELGGKRRRRVDVALLEQRLAGLEQESQRADVASLVTIRFAKVLGAQRRVDALARYVEYVKSVLHAATRMSETGAVRSLERHQVQRRLGLARIDLQGAETDLAVARLSLAATWGASVPGFERAQGDLEQIPRVPDVETLIEMARGNVASERWDTEYVRRRAALSLAKSGAVPDLTVGVGTAWEEGGRPPDYLISFEIDLPIFDAKQGDIREARARLSRARLFRDAAEAEIARQVREVYSALNEAATRSATLGAAIVPSARANFEATRAGFEGQEERLDDLLDSRRDLASAERDHADALVDFHQALAVLENLVGSDL